MKSMRILYLILFLVAIPYAIWWAFFRPAADSYIKCNLYTEAMNGGVKKFEKKSYKIVLCGLNGIIQPENFHDDEVRLQIFTMSGELQAERYYPPLLGLIYAKQIHYCDNYLLYRTSAERHLGMVIIPPDQLEWLRARLPRILPLWGSEYVDGVFEWLGVVINFFKSYGPQIAKPDRLDSCEV